MTYLPCWRSECRVACYYPDFCDYPTDHRPDKSEPEPQPEGA